MKVTKIPHNVRNQDYVTKRLKVNSSVAVPPTDHEAVVALFAAKERHDLGFSFISAFKEWDYRFVDGWHVHFPKGNELEALLALPDSKRVRHQEANNKIMAIYPFL